MTLGHAARNSNTRDVISNGISGSRRLTPLMTAVKYRQGACIPILLNTGADVNVRNDSEVTALLIALKEDYYGVINVLLHAGADVNDADGNGMPALMVAAEMANFHSVNALLKLGADVNTKDACGCTALMKAVKALYFKSDLRSLEEWSADQYLCIKSLLKAGAETEANAGSLETITMEEMH